MQFRLRHHDLLLAAWIGIARPLSRAPSRCGRFRDRIRDRLERESACRAPERTTGPLFGDGVVAFERTIHHRIGP
jgi:hypothetical protein